MSAIHALFIYRVFGFPVMNEAAFAQSKPFMIFNSFQFLWLFPIIFGIYYAAGSLFKGRLKNRVSNTLLLLISYLLYMQWNPAYTLILFGVTLCTYFTAIIIEDKKAYGKRKYIITAGALLTFLPLFIFKYYNFILSIFNDLFALVGISIGLPGLNWAIPIGLSFFTFQAVGYLWDVYYKKIEAERNILDYMLFVAFFPQIMSGPISKASSLLPQIKAERVFDYNSTVQGLKWLLWGFFLKCVMADRLGIYVDTIYSNFEHYNGVTCLFSSILYSFQIYGDFAGYSLMAIGVGRLLGFDLINNFNRPYFSASITEFWRRWHISLSTWLKDYIYIPLGGSRCSKLRSYWNIVVTFLVSGIWHGANWTFIIWGLIHGGLQIIEKVLDMQKCNSKGIVKVGRILLTFSLVNFAWIFFRMPDFNSAINFCANIFSKFKGNLYISTNTDFALIMFSLSCVFISEVCTEISNDKIKLLNNKYPLVRWGTYLVLITIILIFGVFDSSQFIYVSF